MHFRSKHRRRWVALGLTVALLGATPAAWAKREPTREELLDRIERLEAIIKQNGLDKKPAPGKARATVAEPATAPPLEKPEVEAIVEDKLRKQKVLAGWNDGFYLQSPNGDFKLKLRGYLQSDARFFPLEGGDTGTDSFFLRRVRPIFEGTVFKYFDFRIMPDFGNGQTVLQDAYADVTYFKPWTTLRTGKFKNPLSLERLQSGQDLLFIERSLANNLAPNRDVGLQFGGDFFDGALSYQLGVFNGDLDGLSNDGATTSDKTGAARIFGLPFKNTDIDPLKGFGIGIASDFGNTKKAQNMNQVAYKTSGRSNFFKYASSSSTTILQDGQQFRLAPQAYYYWGPFGAMGEWIRSEQGVRSSTTSDDAPDVVKHGTFINDGWFAQASYVLTGEDASYRSVVPINPFDPYNGRWGAFELALRGGNVRIDKDLFEQGFAKKPQSTDNAWAYGMGVNWYLNKNFKLQANWERTEFANEVDFGGNLRDHEDVLLWRFQIAY